MNLLKKGIANLEAKHKSSLDEYSIVFHSLLTEDILAEPLFEMLSMHQPTSYNGERDFLSHLDKYTSYTELQRASNAIMCQASRNIRGTKLKVV